MTGSEKKSNLTDRQQKWFASVKEGLEKETGKSFAEWVKIAKTCPETKPAARKKWFKAEHGLGVNRASVILAEAFPSDLSWSDADGLKDALWKDPAHREIYHALEEIISGFDDVTVGARKSFVGFSRKVQFAAARPYKGQVRLGIAVLPETDTRFAAPLKSEGWSDRLKSAIMLPSKKEINTKLVSALKQAWESA